MIVNDIIMKFLVVTPPSIYQLPTGDRLDHSGDISKDYLPMDYFFFSFPTEKKK